ncbi:helix-turn-helix domain-containing protein [Tsukamurella sp. DT100]|uniref:helix-turn-helix domain-containing protein n=1 Tax=Tsukamurella sp. DT100 TaxID=3393415 RepID=UPI003CE8B4C2
MNTWERDCAHAIGQEVRRRRGKRSAQWLADRVTEIGVKMTRQSIADLENGRRRYVTTGELAVLAAALDTAPAQLLYPGLPTRDSEVLPGITTSSGEALLWFNGHWRIPVPGGNDTAAYEMRETMKLVWEYINLKRAIPELRLQRSVEAATTGGPADDSWAKEMQDRINEIAKILESKRLSGDG